MRIYIILLCSQTRNIPNSFNLPPFTPSPLLPFISIPTKPPAIFSLVLLISILNLILPHPDSPKVPPKLLLPTFIAINPTFHPPSANKPIPHAEVFKVLVPIVTEGTCRPTCAELVLVLQRWTGRRGMWRARTWAGGGYAFGRRKRSSVSVWVIEGGVISLVCGLCLCSLQVW